MSVRSKVRKYWVMTVAEVREFFGNFEFLDFFDDNEKLRLYYDNGSIRVAYPAYEQLEEGKQL